MRERSFEGAIPSDSSGYVVQFLYHLCRSPRWIRLDHPNDSDVGVFPIVPLLSHPYIRCSPSCLSITAGNLNAELIDVD